mgnify:FL=1
MGAQASRQAAPDLTLRQRDEDAVVSDATLAALDAAGNPDRNANGVPPLTPVTIESVAIVES